MTGGAGFIGSHVIRLLVNRYPHYRIINVDALTYAGNLDNLADVKDLPNYVFEQCDIQDAESIRRIMERYDVDGIIHLAAESHVDRSISDPLIFAKTNVIGTLTLLECARDFWEKKPEKYSGKKFYHISTDEVYGALDITKPEGTAPYGDTFFTEKTPYSPHSPYSASKASSDHFVRAYHDTYGMPVVISNCSNNYGPNQYPEKLIPLFIHNILHSKPLPVYGKGENVRDWLYVKDHAEAIDLIFHKGETGETYNIGGFNEWKNIELVRLLIRTVDKILGNEEGTSNHLITYVEDRKGHDLRYAIDSSKLQNELGWRPSRNAESGMEETVRWYLENEEWIENALKN